MSIRKPAYVVAATIALVLGSAAAGVDSAGAGAKTVVPDLAPKGSTLVKLIQKASRRCATARSSKGITVAIRGENTPTAVNFLQPARAPSGCAQNKGGGAFRHRRP